MQFNEKGVALVSVIITLTVLLTLASILFEKTWHSTRQVALANGRKQVFWAAQSGIEDARLQLERTYATSSGWRHYLTANTATTYPAMPTWTMSFSGVEVDIYLRDNADGDGNSQVDNDLKIFVLARAGTSSGDEVLIETLCGFAAPSVRGGNRPAQSVTQHLDLAASQVTDYDIDE